MTGDVSDALEGGPKGGRGAHSSTHVLLLVGQTVDAQMQPTDVHAVRSQHLVVAASIGRIRPKNSAADRRPKQRSADHEAHVSLNQPGFDLGKLPRLRKRAATSVSNSPASISKK